jgi:hypothetical protein
VPPTEWQKEVLAARATTNSLQALEILSATVMLERFATIREYVKPRVAARIM